MLTENRQLANGDIKCRVK